MMREIKFRGKTIEGEWIYGDLVTGYSEKTYFIAYDAGAFINTEYQQDRLTTYEFFEVIPETIGQYTGLKDKNGKEIYEGDVIRTHFSFGHEVTQEPFVIKWNKERAMFEGSKPKPLENDYLVTFSFFPEQRFLYEIIGNIHEGEVQE